MKEKFLIEFNTDKVIEALNRAESAIDELASALSQLKNNAVSIRSPKEAALLMTDIRTVGLSPRAMNALRGVDTIGDLITISKLSKKELMKFRNMGMKSVNEIEDFLRKNNINMLP